jgi:hypothetical protein
MRKPSLPLLLVASHAMLAGALSPPCRAQTTQTPRAVESLAYTKRVLVSDYHAESACRGDFDRDGDLDISYGPFWFEGPDFTVRHTLYAPSPYSIFTYSPHFFSFGDDVNGDGWDDVILVGFPGTAVVWFENPAGAGGAWALHLAFSPVDHESPQWLDLDGDGVRELLCAHDGRLGVLRPRLGRERELWVFTALTLQGPFTTFAHGLGAGDVNGDGRNDLITPFGWFEQPPTPATFPWILHAAPLGAGGAQMFAMDVDRDGRSDVVTSLAAHGYGFSWFRARTAAGGGLAFDEHPVLPATPNQSASSRLWLSQLHGVALADIDGDGRDEIVTGKTYLAHNGLDPGEFDPPLLVALKIHGSGVSTRLEAIVLDHTHGIGRAIEVADLDGDGRDDLIVGNKNGLAVYRSRR